MSYRPHLFVAACSLLLLSSLALGHSTEPSNGSGASGDSVSTSASNSATGEPTLAAPTGRVIVLGMDGMDAEMAKDWMDAGELPNFTRLRDQGTFAPLMPANPAQSPVSWATLNTGRNPGKHSIYDFVGMKRTTSAKSPIGIDVGFQRKEMRSAEEIGLPFADPKSAYYVMGGGLILGVLLLLGVGRKNKPAGLVLGLIAAGGGVWYGMSWSDVYPEGGFPDYRSLNMTNNYWETLDENGVAFRGQGTIVSYPVQELEHGKLVAGLGAPDAIGGLNSSAIYTTGEERARLRKNYQAKPANVYEEATSMSAPSGKKAGTVSVYQLTKGDGGRYESKLFGPKNQVIIDQLRGELNTLKEAGDRGERFTELNALFNNSALSSMKTWVPLATTWEKGVANIELEVAGVTQTVALNSWSDFYRVEFVWNPRLSTYAMVRFWAEEIDGELEMFSSPLQIDPDHPTPGSRFCWPPTFASEIASRTGLFETLGWACQTHAVKDAELSDDAFLADIEYTLGWRTALLKDAIADEDWKVLFHFFGTPDRICHMLMRHMDDRHPQYKAELATREVEYFGRKFQLKDSGLVIYQEMDNLVGYLLDEVLGPEDTLMIVSDHGFDSFRRQVDLNAWLAAEGFASLDNRTSIQTPRSVSRMQSQFLQWADWRETQAYSMAIGKIYLNVKGREAAGMVAPEDTDRVLAEITERLYEMTDPESGEKIVKKVYLREDLYDGPYVKQTKLMDENGKPVKDARNRAVIEQEGAAEITIDFVSGYRAAWNATSGGITLINGKDENGDDIAMPGAFVSDNTYAWSGDHCGVDIHNVQGIFFSNRPTSLPAGYDHYDAVHLAPTVLQLANVPIPSDYDSAPLEVK
ncbi:MAG: hypothetical protein GY747_12845 [Planctomycetes bacterium]|nr:hypothetical protein [Planctomycetota bacterium]MCP4770565.1 hypothetical protein [Planctomycetota bacterium]MCP4860344.1 hypothetical protein [Planctomycetota bacterium]